MSKTKTKTREKRYMSEAKDRHKRRTDLAHEQAVLIERMCDEYGIKDEYERERVRIAIEAIYNIAIENETRKNWHNN